MIEAQNRRWIIIGANWRAEIECDDYNLQFEPVRIAEEMATKAVESFKGQENGIHLVLEQGNDILELGGIVLAHEKDENPDKGFILFVAELLANAGYYKESVDVAEKTAKVLKEETEKKSKEKKNKSRKKSSKTETIANEQPQLPKPVVKKPRKSAKKPKKNKE